MKTEKIIATGKLRMAGVIIPVNVFSIREQYGKVRYTVSPINGMGKVRKEDVILDDNYKHLLDNYK